MAETRQFRGISKRLAVQYLENLGGVRVEPEAGVDGDGGSGDADGLGGDGTVVGADEDGPVRVEGDGWSAAVSAETVTAAASIRLTEVTVDFEGDEAVLRPVIEAFERKAMRAGG